MAAKLQRIERELRELAGFAEQRKASQGPRDRAETPSRNPQVEAVAEELHR
jgi:hypothetical protein